MILISFIFNIVNLVTGLKLLAPYNAYAIEFSRMREKNGTLLTVLRVNFMVQRGYVTLNLYILLSVLNSVVDC